MNHRVVPTRPSLEQYRKQAKDLLDGIASRVPDALTRVVTHHPRLQGLASANVPASNLKLADAQLVIAREHAFESWPRFAAHLRTAQSGENVSAETSLRVGDAELSLEIAGRSGARALVVFALAGNVGRYHPGIRKTATAFNEASICTVLADLLTEEEEVEDAIHEALRYDIPLLANRMLAIIDHCAGDAALRSLHMGVFGSGTGAAAGVAAAAKRSAVRAIACSAGRPDLAGPSLAWIGAPTLFVFGGEDTVGYGFMRTILDVLPPRTAKRLEVIDGAAARFDATEHVERASALATAWFTQHLAGVAGEKQS